jgi:CHASE2 domain-containing sensor protein
MKKQVIGIILGSIAGIIDVIPMVIQKLTWDANISAFTMWVVVGFLVATVDLKIKPVFKGILIAILVLSPSAILIGWKEPASLIPIMVMTLVLGSLLGFFINKYTDG